MALTGTVDVASFLQQAAGGVPAAPGTSTTNPLPPLSGLPGSSVGSGHQGFLWNLYNDAVAVPTGLYNLIGTAIGDTIRSPVGVLEEAATLGMAHTDVKVLSPSFFAKIPIDFVSNLKNYYLSKDVMSHLYQHPLEPVMDAATIAGGIGVAGRVATATGTALAAEGAALGAEEAVAAASEAAAAGEAVAGEVAATEAANVAVGSAETASAVLPPAGGMAGAVGRLAAKVSPSIAEWMAKNSQILADYRAAALARADAPGALQVGEDVRQAAATADSMGVIQAQGAPLTSTVRSGLSSIGDVAREFRAADPVTKRAMFLDISNPESLAIADPLSGHTFGVEPGYNPLIRAVWSDPIRRRFLTETVPEWANKELVPLREEAAAAEASGVTLEPALQQRLAQLEAAYGRMKSTVGNTEPVAQLVATSDRYLGGLWTKQKIERSVGALVNHYSIGAMVKRREAAADLGGIVRDLQAAGQLPEDVADRLHLDMEGLSSSQGTSFSPEELGAILEQKGWSTPEEAAKDYVFRTGNYQLLTPDESNSLLRMVKDGQIPVQGLWRYTPDPALAAIPERAAFEAKFRATAEASGLTPEHQDLMMAVYDTTAKATAAEGRDLAATYAGWDMKFAPEWVPLPGKELRQLGRGANAFQNSTEAELKDAVTASVGQPGSEEFAANVQRELRFRQQMAYEAKAALGRIAPGTDIDKVVERVQRGLNDHITATEAPYSTNEAAVILWDRAQNIVRDELNNAEKKLRTVGRVERKKYGAYIEKLHAVADSTNGDPVAWKALSRTSLGKKVTTRVANELGSMELAQKVGSEIRGATLFGPEFKTLTRIFSTGDFTTYIHEFGHVLRRILPEDVQNVLRDVYFEKVHPGQTWEQVAKDLGPDELFQKAGGEGEALLAEFVARHGVDPERVFGTPNANPGVGAEAAANGAKLALRKGDVAGAMKTLDTFENVANKRLGGTEWQDRLVPPAATHEAVKANVEANMDGFAKLQADIAAPEDKIIAPSEVDKSVMDGYEEQYIQNKAGDFESLVMPDNELGRQLQAQGVYVTGNREDVTNTWADVPTDLKPGTPVAFGGFNADGHVGTVVMLDPKKEIKLGNEILTSKYTALAAVDPADYERMPIIEQYGDVNVAIEGNHRVYRARETGEAKLKVLLVDGKTQVSDLLAPPAASADVERTAAISRWTKTTGSKTVANDLADALDRAGLDYSMGQSVGDKGFSIFSDGQPSAKKLAAWNKLKSEDRAAILDEATASFAAPRDVQAEQAARGGLTAEEEAAAQLDNPYAKLAQEENAVPPAPSFKLPKEVQRSAPRFGYRDGNFSLAFASDRDKAAYILARDAEQGASKAAGKFRAAAEAQGIAVDDLVAHGQDVRAAAKARVAEAYKAGERAGTIDIPETPIAGIAKGVEGAPIEPTAPVAPVAKEAAAPVAAPEEVVAAVPPVTPPPATTPPTKGMGPGWTRPMEEALADDFERWFVKGLKPHNETTLPAFRIIGQQLVDLWRQMRGAIADTGAVPDEAARVFDQYVGDVFTQMRSKGDQPVPEALYMGRRRVRTLDIPDAAQRWGDGRQVEQMPGMDGTINVVNLRERAVQAGATTVAQLRQIFGRGVITHLKDMAALTEKVDSGVKVMDAIRSRVLIPSWKEADAYLEQLSSKFEVLGVEDTRGVAGSGGQTGFKAYVVDPSHPDIVQEVEFTTPLGEKHRNALYAHDKALSKIERDYLYEEQQVARLEASTDPNVAGVQQALEEHQKALAGLEIQREAGRRYMEGYYEMIRDQVAGDFGHPIPRSAFRQAMEGFRLFVAKHSEREMFETGYANFQKLFERAYLPLRIKSAPDENVIDIMEGQSTEAKSAYTLDDERASQGLPQPVYFPHMSEPDKFAYSIPNSQGMRKLSKNPNLRGSTGTLFKEGEYLTDPFQVYSIRAARAIKMQDVFAKVQEITQTYGRKISHPNALQPGEYLFAPDFATAFYKAQVGIDDRLASLIANVDDEKLLAAWKEMTAQMGGRQMSTANVVTEGLAQTLSISDKEAAGLYQAVFDAIPKSQRELVGVTRRGLDLYAVPENVMKNLADQTKRMGVNSFTVAFDSGTHLWRAMALYGSPRWILNNFVGNITMAALEGVKLREVLSAATDRTDRWYLHELARMTGRADEIDRGWFGSSDLYPAELAGRGAETTAGQIERRMLGALKASPVDVFKLPRTYKDFIKRFNSDMENLFRETGFVEGVRREMTQGAVDMPKMRNALRSAWSSKEDMQRMLAYGITPRGYERGMNLMVKTFGDFSTLSPFERNVIRRYIAPFYGFYRHVGKMLIRAPFEHPFKSQLAAQLAREDQEMRAQYGPLPGYTDQMVPWGPIGPDGKLSFLSVAGPNPFNPFADLGLSVLHPAIQWGVEMVTGRDTFTGQEFTDPNVVTPYGSDQRFRIIRGPDGQPMDAVPVDKVTPSPGVGLLSQFPFYSQAKALVAGGRPYDTEGILGSIGNPVTNSSGDVSSPYGVGNFVGQQAGINVKNYDIAAYQARLEEQRQAALQMALQQWSTSQGAA